jgi:putative aldouronate transport system permease protein
MMRLKKNTLHYHLMLIPGMLFVLIFNIMPLFGTVIAFQNFIPAKGILHSAWVGLDNFKYMFQLNDSKQIIFNTIFISVMKMILNLVIPVSVAILLNELVFRKMKKWMQTIIYFPHFMSWVILAGIVSDLLSTNGILNLVIQFFGGKPILFLGSDFWFPIVIIFSDVWKEFGFNSVVFFSAITAINTGLYEAAEIDGAGRLRKIWSVTLPGIMPTIVLIATLNIGQVLNAGFEQILNLYNPLVYTSGDIIDTYVYRTGLLESQYGLATAVGSLKSLIGFILIFISYKLADKFANYRIF